MAVIASGARAPKTFQTSFMTMAAGPAATPTPTAPARSRTSWLTENAGSKSCAARRSVAEPLRHILGMGLDPLLGHIVRRLLVDDDCIRPFADVVRIETDALQRGGQVRL